jgi:hypothetical protein
MPEFERGEGKDCINIFFQRDHYTFWGKGICIHLYEDGCLISDKKLEAIGKILEED